MNSFKQSELSHYILRLCLALLAMLLGLGVIWSSEAYCSTDDILQNYRQEQPKFDSVMALSCTSTPAVWYGAAEKPPFYSTNNLRRKVGYAQFASGQCIQIIGRVLDRSCVPIQNALVQMWHADKNGFYRYNSSEKRGYLNDNILYTAPVDQIPASNIQTNSDKLDKMFVGSGSAITDNLGYYRFYTIMPGIIEDSSPRVHFNIVYSRLMRLETTMFFPGNYRDSELRAISDSELLRGALVAIKLKEEEKFYDKVCPIYRFDITMNIDAKYREY